MLQKTNTKIYDLEERTLNFSKEIIRFCKGLSKNTVNFELISQLIRSACSIGANYIEANEALSKKDFIHRVKISRKEAKETIYWLNLVLEINPNLNGRINSLIKEAIELKKILSVIIERSS
ncbi:MAG: four helix bundle protein [Patescibacteria group bacterium]|nr:four helix bundle protein [Patescibacteria group bacterium]